MVSWLRKDGQDFGDSGDLVMFGLILMLCMILMILNRMLVILERILMIWDGCGL